MPVHGVTFTVLKEIIQMPSGRDIPAIPSLKL
jgi:hypothetical protein